jgi:crotonobetainyl-CoA:carnitine CoA-transferase CaiB-like acyl-CoA transferase
VGSPAGPVEVLLPPVVSPGWATRLDPVPALGEHTRVVLAELGYSDGEVEELAASSALIPSHIDRSLS